MNRRLKKILASRYFDVLTMLPTPKKAVTVICSGIKACFWFIGVKV